MPIDLTKLSQSNAANKVIYTPKFFSKDFTGTGLNNGLIRQTLNPLNITLSYKDSADEPMMTSNLWSATRNTIDDNASYEYIYQNVNPFCKILNSMEYSPVYSEKDYLTDWCKLTDKIAIRVLPYMVRTKITTPKAAFSTARRSGLVSYLIQLKSTQNQYSDKFIFNNPITVSDQKTINIMDIIRHSDQALPLYPTQNIIYNYLTLTPKQTYNAIIHCLNTDMGLLNNQAYSKAKTYFDDLSLYDMLSILSEQYQKHIVKYFEITYETTKSVNAIASLLDIINTLHLPLDQYQQIFNFIKQNIKDPETVDHLIDLNLNLKFNRLLNQLNAAKPSLITNNKTAPVDPELSTSQKNAVTTKSPLSLIEAGAGTGKSSVILNRIKYLIDTGIDPKDILVLSFTNAAADHIKNLYKGVNAMTINTLVNTIYKSDQPDQDIVSDKTFYNTLLINYRDTTSSYMQSFMEAARLLTLKPTEEGINYLDEGFRQMSNAIREKPNVALKICQTLGQVTLNMQMLLTYQFLNKFSLPDQTQCKYLLVDEVQDNSIFDFMFLLKYTLTQKCNFFIVGDASQTLYAFRNANPRAMNVLESSNVFDIFKLDINFRSRQEILSYANVLLNQTESNIFAKIQLQANDLRKPTAKDFDNNVKLWHMETHTFNGPDNAKTIRSFILSSVSIKNYIDKCLNRGEKIAFLAFRHDSVVTMQKAVQELLKTKNTADISSRHNTDMTLFSGFWANFSDKCIKDLLAQPANKILDSVEYTLVFNNPDTDFSSSLPAAIDYKQAKWDDFARQNSVRLTQSLNDVKAKKLTKNKYLKLIMDLSLSYEIGFNRVLQQTAKDRNNTDQKLKAMSQNNLIFSTIHSSKGLEFDNVVLLMQTPYRMEDEAIKRLYYVGLTRAKNSEYVILQDTEPIQNSVMTTNYKIARNKFK